MTCAVLVFSTRATDTFGLYRWHFLLWESVKYPCCVLALLLRVRGAGWGVGAWHEQLPHVLHVEESRSVRTGAKPAWCSWCTGRAFGPKWLLQKGGDSLWKTRAAAVTVSAAVLGKMCRTAFPACQYFF